MAFLDVNRKKLEYLLSQGTHDGELKKFFYESRAQLILKGARVQNLPIGRDERIRGICERLPPKTDDILRDWFQKNILVSDPEPASDVVSYLKMHFDEDEHLRESDARLVTRSALKYLFEDTPDQELLTFLQVAPGAQSTLQDSPSGTVSTDQEIVLDEEAMPGDESVGDAAELHDVQLFDLLASIITGDDSSIDNALSPFSQNTRAFVEAMLRARDGEIDAASEQLALLNEHSPESELVKNAIYRAKYRRGAKSVPTGVHVHLPKPLDEVRQSDSYDIIGIVTNESKAGAIFVRPLLLVEGEKIHLLSLENRLTLFPESGDVMTHRSVLQRPLKRRDLVHWRVAEREDVEGEIHFHLESELSPLIEVVKVPVPSTDPDEVREWIKAKASSGRTLENPQTIFILSDGVAVVSPTSAVLTREEAFEHPWQAWSSLETWIIEGHQYCLELAQEASSNLDLSPLDAAFRMLLKDLEAEKNFTLSRAQKRELSALLREHAADEVALRAQRVASSLDRIVFGGEELDEVLRLLNSHEEVQRRVEQLVVKELDERLTEKSGLQKEIENLELKKSKLEKEIREFERNNKNLAGSAEAAVREAFSKAVAEGISTLTHAEIFRTLMGNTASTSPVSSTSDAAYSLESWTVMGELTRSDVRQRLIALGLNARQATVLSELSTLTMQSGVGFVLKGSEARQYTQLLVRMDCEASGMIEVPMGLTTGAFIQHALDLMPDIQRVALLDADLSPLEVYGARLLDTLYDSELGGQRSQKSILLSCTGGEMSLPLPDFLKRIAIIVDLNTPWDEGERTLEEIEIDSIPLLKSQRSRILERISTLEESTRKHVERVLVKSIETEEE